jgi:hypothetical protein
MVIEDFLDTLFLPEGQTYENLSIFLTPDGGPGVLACCNAYTSVCIPADRCNSTN